MSGASLVFAVLCCRAAGPGFCRGSSDPVPPRLPWAEVMGDSKEAGAESPPTGAAARGGLSLLSQGESEEPSAQVSPSWGGTCWAPGAAGPLLGGGMLRFVEAADAFSASFGQSPKRSGSPCVCGQAFRLLASRSLVSKAVLASLSVTTGGRVRHDLGSQGAYM